MRDDIEKNHLNEILYNMLNLKTINITFLKIQIQKYIFTVRY